MPSAVSTCALAIFGYTVASVLSSPHFSNSPRDIDALEVFTVAESVVHAARGLGLHSMGFDYMNKDQKSVTGQDGFHQVLTLTMRVKEGGLLCIAPDCRSFSWSCSSKTKRTKVNIAGDISCTAVRDGNFIAEVALFLYILGIARGLHVCLENPSGSTLFTYLKKHLDRLNEFPGFVPQFFYLDRCAFVKIRPTFKKRFKVMASSQWFAPVARDCSCNCKHLELMKKVLGRNGKVQVNGCGPQMKESGLYPPALGEASVQAWRQWLTSSREPSPPLSVNASFDPWSSEDKSAPSKPKGPGVKKTICKKSRKQPKTVSSFDDENYDPWG